MWQFCRKLVNRLPLCFRQPNRIFLSNGKHQMFPLSFPGIWTLKLKGLNGGVCVWLVAKMWELDPNFVFLFYKQGFFSYCRIDSLAGSANADIDYLPMTGVILNFQPGETIRGLIIDIIDDDLIEGAEKFSITLSIAIPRPGVTIERPSVTQITITDMMHLHLVNTSAKKKIPCLS